MPELGRSTSPKLHQPIAPYFSDAYTSLISAAQGIAVYAVIWQVMQGESGINETTVLQGTITS